MTAEPHPEIAQDLAMLIKQVMAANKLDPSSLNRIWSREMTLKDVKGVLAIAQRDSGEYYAIVNMPVLVMPVNGVTLSFAEILQLLTCVGEIPTAQYSIQGNNLYFSLCLPVAQFNEGQIPEVLDRLMEGVMDVRANLLTAVNRFYSGNENAEATSEGTDALPQLPEIKMTPSDARVIYGVLARCNPQVQEIYKFLMEKWAKAGFFVETTSSSIVLDIPYGPRRARLAVLLPGTSDSAARLNPGAKPEPPELILMWENLRKQTGFPVEALDSYQKTVRKMARLHFTESSAHLEMDAEFNLPSARKLLKAMIELAHSVQPERVEPPATSKPVTPDNIARTLDICDARTGKVFSLLLDGWKQAGGTVQCSTVGRIYLRLKTRAHKAGKVAQIPRNFNLVVLVAPKGKTPAKIQITWDLAADVPYAYLDCIPREVAEFERTAFNLPGFEKKGTIVALVMGRGFKEEHAHALLSSMIAVKDAEEKAR